MGNTSASGGYLRAAATMTHARFRKAIQEMVAGITGLDGAMVRANYQAGRPKVPDVGVNWCGFAITAIRKQDYAAQVHVSGRDDDPGSVTLVRHEQVTVAFSFYGDEGLEMAGALRDGLCINQNFEAIQRQYPIALHDCGDIALAADLLNEQWVRRYTLSVTFAVRLDRHYEINSLLSAPFRINPSHT